MDNSVDATGKPRRLGRSVSTHYGGSAHSSSASAPPNGGGAGLSLPHFPSQPPSPSARHGSSNGSPVIPQRGAAASHASHSSALRRLWELQREQSAILESLLPTAVMGSDNRRLSSPVASQAAPARPTSPSSPQGDASSEGGASSEGDAEHWKKECMQLQLRCQALESEVERLSKQQQRSEDRAKKALNRARRLQSTVRELSTPSPTVVEKGSNGDEPPSPYKAPSRVYDPIEVEKHVIKMQRRVRRGRLLRRWYSLVHAYSKMATVQPQLHRTRVARAILDSERTYVRNLNLIVARLMMPLEGNHIEGVLMEKAETKCLFSNVLFVMLKVNQVLLRELEVQFEEWPSAPLRVESIFTKTAPFLKCYTDYTANFGNALLVLAKWQKKPAFREWSESMATDPVVSHMRIDDFLILPIRRIQEYLYQLQELLRLTQRSHPHYHSLVTAVGKIKEVGQEVECMRSRFSPLEGVYHIQQILSGPCPNLVKPHRSFLGECDCMEMSVGQGDCKQGSMRHAFLFNDVLVLTSADNSRKVTRVLPLYKSHVDFGDDGENEDVGSESTITVTSGKEEVTLDFIEDDTYSVWCTWLQECIARTSPVSQARKPSDAAQATFPHLEGHLFRRGHHRATWKRRLCEASNGWLHVFGSCEAKLPSTSLPLWMCTVEVVEDSDSAYVFEVRCDFAVHRPLRLKAKSAHDLDQWMEVLDSDNYIVEEQYESAQGFQTPYKEDPMLLLSPVPGSVTPTAKSLSVRSMMEMERTRDKGSFEAKNESVRRRLWLEDDDVHALDSPEEVEWEEYTNDDGIPFFYNRRTKLSVWERPEEMGGRGGVSGEE